jgi:AraC-like DNA-binding protein
MVSAFLFTAALQGVFLSLALIVKKTENRASNIYLSLILIYLSLQLLFSWGGRNGFNNQNDIFPYWIFLSDLVIPPSLWLFLKHNSDSNFKFKPKQLLIYSPVAIQIIIDFLYSYVSTSAFYSFIDVIVRSTLWHFCTEELPLFATIAVLAIYLKKIIFLKKQFKGLLNPSVRMHLIKMYWIFFLFCILTLMWAALVLFNIQLFHLIEITCVATIFVMGYVAYLRPDFFELPKLLHAKYPESNSFKNYDDINAFARLKKLFEDDCIYSRSKLTLKELSDELKLPQKYVSYLINTYSLSNFNDFVNSYRVKDVLRRIPIEKNKNLLGIALDAGFNSKSTFNQVFKQHTGRSPSEYLS